MVIDWHFIPPGCFEGVPCGEVTHLRAGAWTKTRHGLGAAIERVVVAMEHVMVAAQAGADAQLLGEAQSDAWDRTLTETNVRVTEGTDLTRLHLFLRNLGYCAALGLHVTAQVNGYTTATLIRDLSTGQVKTPAERTLLALLDAVRKSQPGG